MLQCFWQEVVLTSPVSEVRAALALRAPKAAVTPVPWGKVGSVPLRVKVKEYKDFSMGSGSFFTLSSPLQYKLENPEILVVPPYM